MKKVEHIRPSEVQAVVKRLLPNCVDVKDIKAHVEFNEDGEYPKMNLFVKFSVKGFEAETNHLEADCDYTDDNAVVFKMITDFVWCISRMCRDRIMARFLVTDVIHKDELLPEVEQSEVH